jgi:hypothetical protein
MMVQQLGQLKNKINPKDNSSGRGEATTAYGFQDSRCREPA